jgi:membrane protease subunit (stomatin/prohibitin family)
MLDIKVEQPVLLINSLVGTQGIYTTDAIEEYLNRVIVSRFNDFMGENLDTLFNLPAKYDELSEGLKSRVQDDFSRYGLELCQLFINSITPPPNVQKAIDDKSRLAVFDDLNRLIKMKAAMALEKASEAQGETGAGLGMGMGMMMPWMVSEALKTTDGAPSKSGRNREVSCPQCRQSLPGGSKFCPHCGHHLLVFRQCSHCGEKLLPNARFCSQCGRSMVQGPEPKKCSRCEAENLPEATFCNQCGERTD